jgi:hypothetical protein
MEQESRTLEMNNVQDGIWHGRGDTICVGSYSEGNKVFLELHPPSAVAAKSPDICSMQKSTDLSDQSSTWSVWASMTLISASTYYQLPLVFFPEERVDTQAVSPILFMRSHQRAAWSICCLYSDCCLFKSEKITCLWVSDEEEVCSPCRRRRWTLLGYWLDPCSLRALFSGGSCKYCSHICSTNLKQHYLFHTGRVWFI